jgi:putative phage-type endonuclease
MDMKDDHNRLYLTECLEWMSKQDLCSSSGQKSSAWLETRHSMITASDVHKCLSSEAQRNSLIRDKIHPKPSLTSASSLEHGNMFEPVARRFYEILHHCQPVQEYGCLRHQIHSFIGASPDGAVTDTHSFLYGRLLEIKVPKSRELCLHERYIPIAYWEQMQIQMEVTGLPCCDYLECKVEVFDSQKSYEECASTDHLFKGLLLHFRSTVTGKDIYEIWFHQMDNEEDYDAFLVRKETEMRDVRTGGVLVKLLFWKIEKYFLATVQRDSVWFTEVAFPRIQSTWIEIEEGRKDPAKAMAGTTRKRPYKSTPKEELTSSQIKEVENTVLQKLSCNDEETTSSSCIFTVSLSSEQDTTLFIDTSMCI